MPFTQYDLRNADERIAEVAKFVDRQRVRLDSLQAHSEGAVWVEQVMTAMERTLRSFQEYRRRIEDELRSAKESGQK
jgi:hypothetical protein